MLHLVSRTLRTQSYTGFLAVFLWHVVPVLLLVLLTWIVPFTLYAQEGAEEDLLSRSADEAVADASLQVSSASDNAALSFDNPSLSLTGSVAIRVSVPGATLGEATQRAARSWGGESAPVDLPSRLIATSALPSKPIAAPRPGAGEAPIDAAASPPPDVSAELLMFAPRADQTSLISIDDAEMELSVPRVPARVTPGRDRSRFWKWPAQDALALARGLASETGLAAVGGGAVLLVAARHDMELTSDIAEFSPRPSRLVVRVVEEFGNVRAVRPLAAAVFLGSLMTDDDHLQDAAFTSLEAVILSNLVTSGLKSVFGRARPFQNEGALEFKPFSGNTSFPSGHATTAFAVVTPWLLYYPSALTPGLIVLSTGTAFTRMLTHNHWFTDVVAGSAIGFATAYLLSQRHQNDASRVRLAPSVGPDQMGVTMSVKMP